MLHRNINTIKRNEEALLNVNIEVNAHKTKYMLRRVLLCVISLCSLVDI
jgi:hypothetical protein